MRAIILAAGYATRLYPLTLNRPKPLLLINKKTILERILDKIRKIKEIEKIYIVTNNKFYKHFSKWLKNYPQNENIFIFNDGTTEDGNKLGAVGDINFAIENAGINEDVLITGGDNLFEFDLVEIYKNFKKNGNTVALKDLCSLNLVSKYSTIELDRCNKIINFIEKPKEPKSTLIATCIYLYKKETLKLIKEYLAGKKNPDAPGYFVQWLHKRTPVHGFVEEGAWFDIGDINSYKEADKLYKKLKL